MRPGPRTSLAVLVCVMTAACALVNDAEQLRDTAWQVVEIDGDEVPSGEVILFLEGDSATLVTQPMTGNRNVDRHCAESGSEMVLESDGRALRFLGLEDEGSRVLCDPGMEELHARISAALRDNESWEAKSEGLDLIGSNRVKLELLAGSE